MLDAKTNRLYYDALLKAPQGYVFDHAITTTYSLDLEAILLVPIALFFSEDFDFNPDNTRDDLIEALTKASDHITIFCQRGKIQVPQPYNKLIAFWEKGIHQIQMPYYTQSFHPKIWVIRYTSENKKDPVFYRFLCSSRNLTFSREWDLAVSSEGFVDASLNGENKGIVDMLNWLNGHKKRTIPADFFKEIQKVQFNVPPKFSSIAFHPIGISENYPNPITDKEVKQDERLVVSPFLKESTLIQLLNKSRQLYLFSTHFEFSQIKASFLDKIGPVFRFAPFIEDAEKMDSFSEADEIPMSQNLHAKLFIDKKGKDITWYIGSANATSPASKGNVEFMVELNTVGRALGPSKIKEQFLAGLENGIALFEPFEGEESPLAQAEIIREQEIRRLIHALSSIEVSGEVEINNDNKYDLTISFPKINIEIPEGFEVKVKPLPEKQKASFQLIFGKEIEIKDFTGYEEIELSPYLIFEIWDTGKLVNQFVLDMKIGLDSNRLDRIFTSIINSKTRFLNYLFFLMSEEISEVHDGDEETKKKHGPGYGEEIAFFADTPLYEKLLFTASRNNKKLGSINKLVQRMKAEVDENGEQIITEEFLNMWNVFHAYTSQK